MNKPLVQISNDLRFSQSAPGSPQNSRVVSPIPVTHGLPNSIGAVHQMPTVITKPKVYMSHPAVTVSSANSAPIINGTTTVNTENKEKTVTIVAPTQAMLKNPALVQHINVSGNSGQSHHIMTHAQMSQIAQQQQQQHFIIKTEALGQQGHFRQQVPVSTVTLTPTMPMSFTPTNTTASPQIMQLVHKTEAIKRPLATPPVTVSVNNKVETNSTDTQSSSHEEIDAKKMKIEATS
ncbi:unnamed protein product [Owenia fusiformis]|uniref:Uncharacterized protein n=1 Tax=Owenia fusiformis TaxID=6347 RepID=A0A8S4PMI1_OWEFU|nr:unnamed protein product [Owenia fusiformis]